jgi:predicted enzyme related to lactoylglutathione lyase
MSVQLGAVLVHDTAKRLLVGPASRATLADCACRRRRHPQQRRPPSQRKLIGRDEFRGTTPVHFSSVESVPTNPLVHLELETWNLPRACSFYTRLLGWQAERIVLDAGSYVALELGTTVQGGVVERDTGDSLWLPYVEVPDVVVVTDRGRALGAEVLVQPCEGPAGWRSVLLAPTGEKVALWQPKI